MTLRQLSSRRGHRALLRHGEPAAEPGAVLERRADAGRGSCSPSPGHGRSAPRSAEVGFTAALDKGTNQDAATDQRALGDGGQVRNVSQRTIAAALPADAFYEWKVSRAASSLTRSLDRTGSRWRSPACGRASAGQTKR